MTTPVVIVNPVGLPGPAGPAALFTVTAVKTAGYTASNLQFVPVDTTSGAVTITLPTTPADQTIIGVKMVVQASAHTVTVATGGSDRFNVAGGATTLTLSLLFQGVIAQYSASAALWYVTTDDLPLAQLDGRYLQLSGGTMSGVIAMGANKVTGLANGTAGTDAAAFGQVLPIAGGTMTGWLAPAEVGLTFGTSIAVNAALGNVFAVTLTASTGTLANPTNPVDGQAIRVRVIQGGTGSFTLAYGTAYDFGTAGSPTLSTAVGKVDILGFEYVASLTKWCFLGSALGM